MQKIMLVVDDMEVNRAILVEIFNHEYHVLQAGDGQEAIEVLNREEVSVVLLDINMPVMGGFEVLTKAKNDERLAKIPFIINTQMDDDESEMKALQLGAADFIMKPYNPVLIRQRVRNIVQKTVLERQKLENDLKEASGRLQSLIDSIPGGIAICEMGERIILSYFNDPIFLKSGYTREEFEEWISKDFTVTVFPEDRPVFIRSVKEAVQNNKPIRITYRSNHKNGGFYWLSLSAVRFKVENGHPIYHAVFMDITEEKISQEKMAVSMKELHYRMERDSLTGIYNREYFCKEAAARLECDRDTEYLMACLDIEHFKIINDLYGTEFGDHVLRCIAKSIADKIKGVGIYGRMESDHFALCCPKEVWEEYEILKFLKDKINTFDVELDISVYAGIYEIDDILLPVDQMYDRASLAVHSIKGNYLKHVAYYDNRMRKVLLEEQEIINDMREALDAGQFSIHLQPVFRVSDEMPVSAEVLVRWNHPRKGMLSPYLFIPVFEKNGFITKLDYYVWECACRFLKECRDSGKPLLPVSVNVSRINMYNPRLCEDICELLSRYQLEPSLLKLEITESAYTDNPQQLIQMIRVFKKKGFKILMDDFGSGYSSLNMLKEIPVDILKVDMRFMDDLETSKRAGSIMTSVIHMAKCLEMDVITEGVETKSQLDFLKKVKCDCVQGYYFAKPMPKDEYCSLIEEKMQAKNID